MQPDPAPALGLSPHTAVATANGLLLPRPMDCARGLSHTVAAAPGWEENGLAAAEVGLPKVPLGLSQDRELSSGGRLRVGIPPAAASSKKPRPPLLDERLSSGEKEAEPWRRSGEAEPDPCRRSLPLHMT